MRTDRDCHQNNTSQLNTESARRREAINSGDLLPVVQRDNAAYEILYDEAAPGAAGLTQTAQCHDANGNGAGIRRGVSGSFYVVGGGTVYVHQGSVSAYPNSLARDNTASYPLHSGTTHSYEMGWIKVSPGIQKILVVLVIKASTAEYGPQMRVRNLTDGTGSDDYEGDGDWTDLTTSPERYLLTVPVTDAAPALAEKVLDIEVRSKDPKGENVTYTLYLAMPVEHLDEPEG